MNRVEVGKGRQGLVKKSVVVLALVLVALVSLLPLLPILPAYADDGDSETPVSPITLRSISGYYIPDINGNPVSYVLEQNADHYQVKTASTAVKFFDYYTKVWNDNFSKVSVYDDRWSVEYLNKQGKWVSSSFYNVVRSFEILSKDELRVYRTGDSIIGKRTEVYIFKAGQPCKVEIRQTCIESQTIRYNWILSGIVANPEVLTFTTIEATNETKQSGLTYKDSNGDFVFEAQWLKELTLTDNINSVCESSAQGRKATITFGDFTVLAGKIQILDPTFRSAGVSPGADSTSVVVVKPVGLASGDLMIAHIVATGTAAQPGDPTTPTGWTKFSVTGSGGGGSVGVKSTLFWHTANVTDAAAASFTFTSGSSTASSRGAITAWTGYHTVTPIADESAYSTATGVVINALAVTPTYASSVITFFASLANNYNVGFYAITTSDPGGWSEAYDLPSNLAEDLGLSLAYVTRPETTATGAGTANATGSTRNIGHLVVISPSITAPTVTTQAVSSVEEATATGNGEITVTGGENASRRGFCYMVGVAGDPTVANSTVYDDGSFGAVAYTKGMTGLTPGESYRVRAYAVNTGGTGYGATVQMSTKCEDPTGLVATSNTSVSIALSWTKGTGSENTTILYKTTGYPANVTDGTVCYNNTGSSSNITPLTPGQNYYFRAWAWDTNAGYSDGFDSILETTPADPPTVTTQAVSAITAITATGNGEITDLGSLIENADIRGICWNTAGTPTVTDDKAQENGSFIAEVFSENMTGLVHSTHYHVRAFAHNSGGYGYGAEVTFTTLDTIPTVTTQAASGILTTYALGNFEITDTGGENSDNVGIEWGLATTVYTSENMTGGSYVAGVYTTDMAGLAAGTTYYYRGKAHNSLGWGYGNEMSFSTAPVSPPIVVTAGASGIYPTYATLQGTLMDLGSSSSIGMSFEYGTTLSYGSTTPETQLIAMGGYTYQIANLSYNTLYHFRARGRYGLFYTYGGDMTFTTLSALGSSTDIQIINAKVFKSYLAPSNNDLLLVVEAKNSYTNLYPNQDAGEHFTIQLLAVNKIDILGASPLANWGDRPESIYFNPTAAATLTYGSAYWVRMLGDAISGNITVDYQLTAADWKGSDLTKLDSWCIGTAINMQSSDSRIDYLINLTDVGTVINDPAGGYFTKGIPAITRIRPSLFATSKQIPEQPTGAAGTAWDDPLAWATNVGSIITADATVMAAPLGLNGRDFLAGIVLLLILGFIISVASFGALGGLLISVPVLWVATWFKIVPVIAITVLILFFGFMFIRQLFIKTT